jgi:hypothetical protein
MEHEDDTNSVELNKGKRHETLLTRIPSCRSSSSQSSVSYDVVGRVGTYLRRLTWEREIKIIELVTEAAENLHDKRPTRNTITK